MKITSTLLIASIVVGSLACQDHRLPTTPNTACQVVRNTLLFPSPVLPYAETVNFEGSSYALGTNNYDAYQYDAQGRVSQADYIFSLFPETSNYKANYEYTASQIRETRSHPNGSTSLILYTRNSQGYIANGNGASYQYDSNGYLLSSKSGATERSYSYTNGNVTKREESIPTGGGGTLRTTTQYEYDTTKPSFIAAVRDPYYLIEPGYAPIAGYFGKTSQNLLTKATTNVTSTSANGTVLKSTSVRSYTYVYNEIGLIKRIIASTVNTVDQQTYVDKTVTANDFTYQCPQ